MSRLTHDVYCSAVCRPGQQWLRQDKRAGARGHCEQAYAPPNRIYIYMYIICSPQKQAVSSEPRKKGYSFRDLACITRNCRAGVLSSLRDLSNHETATGSEENYNMAGCHGAQTLADDTVLQHAWRMWHCLAKPVSDRLVLRVGFALLGASTYFC